MSDESERKATESFDWGRYWRIARHRKWYFLIPLFCGWAVVWTVSWFLPTVYRSGTLILVEQPTVPQQFVLPNIAGNLQDRLQSITQQILSRTRLLHIINGLNLYADERRRLSPDDLVERMRKDIEIELVRSPANDQLTSFRIYFSSSDPHVAQRVTSELTNLFISENLEVRQEQSESTTRFLESQVEEARKELSTQEEKLRDFKGTHLGELPGQLQSNLQILAGLQNHLQTEEDALNRAKQQNTYLDSLLAQYRALQSSARSESAPVGLPALDQELDRLNSQLDDLSAHYTDRHPDVRKLKEQITKTTRMKQQILADLKSGKAPQQAESNTSSGFKDHTEVKDATPMAELQSQLKANQLEISDRQRSIQESLAKIGQYQARLNQTPMREQQLADLNRGYDQTRAYYDSLLTKKNNSELATNLEKRQQGEHFRMLDPPSLPAKPYSPHRMMLCGVGLFVGVVLGAGISAGAEFLDDRIYSEEELKKLVPAQILTEIPDLPSVEEKYSQRRQAWIGGIVVGFLLISILTGTAISYFRG
jgi:protein tyrosine kinase modulator